MVKGAPNGSSEQRGGKRPLDWSDHPVDVIKDLSARIGFPPMSPEGEAAARAICDQLVPLDEVREEMAAHARGAIEQLWHCSACGWSTIAHHPDCHMRRVNER